MAFKSFREPPVLSTWNGRFSLVTMPLPIVMVPGLAQRSTVWDEVIALMAPQEAVAVEIPSGGDFEATSRRIAENGPALFAGYSLGGRLCLAAALHAPENVTRLVLISSTAGILGADERKLRRGKDEDLAACAENHGATTFYRRLFAAPVFSTQDRSRSLDHRFDDGKLIAAQLRSLGQGVQESLWGRLHDLEIPVTVVVGERDEKYVRLGSDMVEAIGGNATLDIVCGGGHALVETHPEAVTEILIRASA